MTTTVLQSLSDALAGLASNTRQSLVQVRNGDMSIGAGTIWHAEGLIVTNAHVARRDRLSVVLPDGHELDADVIARDRAQDLAVLVVEATGLPTIELGDSRTLEPGQWVMAMGHPFGIIGSTSAGVVIGMSKHWQETLPSDREWLVVNLQLRPGHSGGPLVDTHGHLVGINTLMNGLDVGVAIPVHVARRFVAEALTV
jgi:serine protease Do